MSESGGADPVSRLRAIPNPVIPAEIDTPQPIVDLAVLDRNIATTQSAMDSASIRVRPHAKTHKCVAIARRQLAAGARGITVGTIGEAEVFAEAGIDDIFIAYPLWVAGPKATRLRALHERIELTVGLDSVAAVGHLADAVAGSRHPLDVLVEVDCGAHRSGVVPTAVGDVSRAAERAGLRVCGAFTHGGHSYASPTLRAAAAHDEGNAMIKAREMLETVGILADVLSAGSTPTVLLGAAPPINEMRPGTYVFNDAMQIALGACEPGSVAFYIAATVVSTAVKGQVILDAGARAGGRPLEGGRPRAISMTPPDHPTRRAANTAV